MKQNLKNSLLVINTILLAVCLVQINDLKMEISNMKSNVGSQLSSILTNVNNSYSYIEETLAKEASIVSKAEWEFGKFDIKARTVEVKAYVIPKEYIPNETQAFFLCNGEEVAAEYSDGKYEVTMNVPLFEDVSIPSVLFKENETIRAESLDWVFNPRNEFLPFVHAYNMGSISYGKSKDKENMGTWTFSGDLEVDVSAKYIEEFEIDITKISTDTTTKNITFKITDKSLIDKTGGIVQGMSGTPIIQDNKIVGGARAVIKYNKRIGVMTNIDYMIKNCTK